MISFSFPFRFLEDVIVSPVQHGGKMFIPIEPISNLISLYTFQRFRNRSLFPSSFAALLPSPIIRVQLTKRPKIVYFPIRRKIFVDMCGFICHVSLQESRAALRTQLLNFNDCFPRSLGFLSWSKLVSAFFAFVFIAAIRRRKSGTSEKCWKRTREANRPRVKESKLKKSDFCYLRPSIKWLFLCLIIRKANGASWEWKTRE